jgi:hypothetical protein
MEWFRKKMEWFQKAMESIQTALEWVAVREGVGRAARWSRAQSTSGRLSSVRQVAGSGPDSGPLA